MSNEKRKAEEYAQLGGMDSKTTNYDSTPLKFLDLQNYDFFTPGALSQRWGSTMYVGQTFPGQINSLFEFARLNGSSYVIESYSGGIFFGATTGQGQGMSFTLQGVTTTSVYAFTQTNENVIGGSFIVGDQTTWGIPYQGGDKLITRATMIIAPLVQSDNTLDYAVLNDFVFAADGNKFFKFDGVTTTPVGLPPVSRPTSSVSLAAFPLTNFTFGGSAYPTSLAGASDFIGMGMTGTYYYYMSYVNSRGFEGPIWPITASPHAFWPVGTSAAAAGGTFLAHRIPISTPLQYGISAINTYVYWNQNVLGVTSGFFFQTNRDLWNNYPYVLLSNTPASGSTITFITLGSTIGGQSALMANNIGSFPDSNVQQYVPLGITYTTSILNFTSYIDSFTNQQFNPRYLESYQNRLFSAGFSASPSTVWFSDIAEPEGYKSDFNFEVRTNDGDVITGLRAYASRLYIFKQKSFHLLVGDDESNFQINQISDQYGAVNNRAIVVFQDILLFLDRKGVMMWNGAGIVCLSTPIQPVFDRMNFAAALTEACAVHDKLKNQVIFSIPVDGSSTNNIMCVYDYNVGAWTTYKGANASAMHPIVGRNGTKNVFYGDYNGRVNWMGPSFLADNGTGFTLYLKSRFFHDSQSSQSMYRRFYLNANNDPGVTLVFNLNFYKDYSASYSVASTMVLGTFQNRIDFGISARSLAFDLTIIQTNLPLRIHGFTIESRYLRKV